MKQIWMLLLASTFIVPNVNAQNSSFRDTSVYGMGGTGRSSDGEDLGHKMGIFGFRRNVTENTDIDMFYMNEGQATNHRDGFGAMAWYNKPVTKQLSVQAGAGGYASMNTVTIDGDQLNQKKLGALVGIAALYNIYGTNVYLTTRYIHTAVPGSADSDIIFVGGGYYFDEAVANVPSNWADPGFDISVMAGNSQTTRANNKLAHTFQIEVRKAASSNVAYSVTIIKEGDSNIADRTGVAAQVWYVIPTADDKWTFSIGAGPYVARDRRDSNKTQVLGLGSMEVSRKLTETADVTLRFTRAGSGKNKDQDMFLVALRKHFR